MKRQHEPRPVELTQPFATFIETEQSDFTVTVPRSFCFSLPKDEDTTQARKVHFASLRMLPDFFNVRNLTLNQDVFDPTKVEQFTLGFYFKMQNVALSNDNNRPVLDLTTYNTEAIIRGLNAKAVELKKTWQANPPFLVDFVTNDYELSDKALFTIFLEKLPKNPDVLKTWYNAIIFNKEKHQNSLFDYKYDLYYPKTNPYSLPRPSVLHQIRVRILVAPHTILTLSNFLFLELLGFKLNTENRLYKKQQQIVLDNIDGETWREFIALDAPLAHPEIQEVEPNKRTYFNFNHLYADGKLHNWDVLTINKFKQQDLLDENTFFTSIFLALRNIMKPYNFDVKFSPTHRMFLFPPPDPQTMPVFKLVVSDIVAWKLGYGLVKFIDADTVKPTSGATSNVKQTFEESAFILCFDTAMVFVTSQYDGASRLVESQDSFMAELKPYPEGILALVSPSDYFRVQEQASGSDYVQLKFHLWTFNDEGERVRFWWPCKARLTGVLKSLL